MKQIRHKVDPHQAAAGPHRLHPRWGVSVWVMSFTPRFPTCVSIVCLFESTLAFSSLEIQKPLFCPWGWNKLFLFLPIFLFIFMHFFLISAGELANCEESLSTCSKVVSETFKTGNKQKNCDGNGKLNHSSSLSSVLLWSEGSPTDSNHFTFKVGSKSVREI